jgi:hypothetical protein
MANPREVLFGPVPDEQKDYWQRNKLAQRDAGLLDSHFDTRSHGKRLLNGQDPSINAYSIPRSQKVALKETSVGGLLVWDGASMAWDEHYARAQSRLLQQNNLPNNLPDPWQGRRAQMSEEIDGGAIMQQRLLANMASPGGSTHGPMPGHMLATGQQRSQQQGQQQVCTLMEGHTFYQPLQIQGFGTTQPLAKTGGQIKGVQGRQFQVEGSVTAYVVDGLQTIDLSKMEPGRLKTLLRVTALLLGTFLVPQEAIQEMGGGPGANRQLLIDSNQQHQINQRQAWANQQNQNNQGLLISQPPSRTPMPQQNQPRPTNPQEILQAQSRELMRRRGLLRG